MIKFGPAGLGGVSEAIDNLRKYKELGFKACEISFTYGIYIKRKEDAIRIGEAAKKLGIQLSIHAPYWINLNSVEEEKVEKSKKRILNCCEVGSYLGASCVVFHPGYYGKMSKEETYENIKNAMLDIVSLNKWDIKLAPETTGKINVFGDIDEILNLVKDTGCSFCVDFAHLKARHFGNLDYDSYFKKFSVKDLHIHISGINYGDKGEKNHIITPIEDVEKLVFYLEKYGKNAVIINESPDPVGDSVKSVKLMTASR